MREILFKAKLIDNCEWIEGSLVHQTDYYGDKVDDYFIIDGTSTQDNDIGYEYRVDPETICQYTGMTDRAKNKVFENSIIKLISENVFGVVKHGEYRSEFESEVTSHIGFYVDWCDKSICGFWRKDLGYWLNDSTVIVGNTIDNAELLEVR